MNDYRNKVLQSMAKNIKTQSSVCVFSEPERILQIKLQTVVYKHFINIHLDEQCNDDGSS